MSLTNLQLQEIPEGTLRENMWNGRAIGIRAPFSATPTIIYLRENQIVMWGVSQQPLPESPLLDAVLRFVNAGIDQEDHRGTVYLEQQEVRCAA